MQDIQEIIVCMGYCATSGGEACLVCPYKGEMVDGLTCRQRLLLDAMKALQDKALKCSELEAKPETNRPSVCFGEGELLESAGEEMAAAYYWRGQADALKWWIQGYFSEQWPQEGEVIKDV